MKKFIFLNKNNINNPKWKYLLMITNIANIIFLLIPTFAFGNFGNALEFDGNNDYVDCGQSDALDITGSLTIEAWVKPYTKNSNLTIVANSYAGLNNSGYAFHINTWNNTDRKIGFETNNGDPIVTRDSVVEFNQWQHIAVTASGVTATVYVNGEAKKVIGNVTLTSSKPNVLNIGAMPNPAYYYKGQIDEVRIWNVVRSQDEIKNNMCQTLVGNETGLVAYYQFDETGVSTTLPDITDNHNDGTLTNMSSTEWQNSSVSDAVVCQQDTTTITSFNTAIPSLNEWGIFLFTMTLMISSIIYIRKRKVLT